jgi:hypothetical protein
MTLDREEPGACEANPDTASGSAITELYTKWTMKPWSLRYSLSDIGETSTAEDKKCDDSKRRSTA